MEVEGEQVAIDTDGVAALEDADNIIIIPGYGMAVAQAQQSVAELTNASRQRLSAHAIRLLVDCLAT